jgi:hypothetical protein
VIVTQLTIKDKSVTPAKLANFLKKYLHYSANDYSLQYYLELAKKLIDGETYQHQYRLDMPDNEFVNMSLIEVLNEDQKYFRERQAEYAYLTDLMNKGANGDAQAAIDFCKAVQEGKYTNSAFA